MFEAFSNVVHFYGLISCYVTPFTGYLSNEQLLIIQCLAYSWCLQYISSVFINMFNWEVRRKYLRKCLCGSMEPRSEFCGSERCIQWSLNYITWLSWFNKVQTIIEHGHRPLNQGHHSKEQDQSPLGQGQKPISQGQRLIGQDQRLIDKGCMVEGQGFIEQCQRKLDRWLLTLSRC